MEIGQDARSGMKCAVCRADHNLRANQIYPLYGIRDLFPKVDTTDPNLSEEYTVHCAAHGKLFLLWCKTCGVKICEDCLDPDHDEHSMKKLKRQLVEQLELKFGGDLSQKLQMRKISLLDVSCQINEIKEKCKNQIKALNENLTQAQVAEKEVMKELQVIEEYFDLDRHDSELETKLLLRLNDANISPRDLSRTFFGQTMSSSCNTQCSSGTKSARKASQYVSEPKTFKSGEIMLHIDQRNPFKVSTGILNTDILGFIFHITGTLAHCRDHNYSKTCKEKMFQISFTSNQRNGSIWDVVTIKYKILLHDWVDFTNTISKTGSAIGGGGIPMGFSADLILHSQLMDSRRNWVNEKNNLKISLELSVYQEV